MVPISLNSQRICQCVNRKLQINSYLEIFNFWIVPYRVHGETIQYEIFALACSVFREINENNADKHLL